MIMFMNILIGAAIGLVSWILVATGIHLIEAWVLAANIGTLL